MLFRPKVFLYWARYCWFTEKNLEWETETPPSVDDAPANWL